MMILGISRFLRIPHVLRRTITCRDPSHASSTGGGFELFLEYSVNLIMIFEMYMGVVRMMLNITNCMAIDLTLRSHSSFRRGSIHAIASWTRWTNLRKIETKASHPGNLRTCSILNSARPLHRFGFRPTILIYSTIPEDITSSAVMQSPIRSHISSNMWWDLCPGSPFFKPGHCSTGCRTYADCSHCDLSWREKPYLSVSQSYAAILCMKSLENVMYHPRPFRRRSHRTVSMGIGIVFAKYIPLSRTTNNILRLTMFCLHVAWLPGKFLFIVRLHLGSYLNGQLM